ncbi:MULTISPECIES: ATP-binding protein [unclassified Leifsonia]|uniref:ATP-binding protein n=1 Tax=unclassified Leifsonia TaxID=2663824 RepID=UPI0007012D11|nr:MULTISPECIES: ATP-binding protein [unclassified Leifsonia]KQX07044.1 histidine kinase [Leifsonia sp. Root1293]KRA11327.1 histidine kinase [Leifsonia sp. Root60]
MTRGRLRVLLGAAPGVGKTYAMLEEGHRLVAAGKDVLVAVVETHGREATAAVLDGLEVQPRAAVEHRGVSLDEMDLDAVLVRRPEYALVDELAHTNAPGSRNEKRWQDVHELLDAGINVYSTVNIQHIASLNDVVQQITGVVQRETIPDAVLRGADQIEVVDLAPQALRDRLSDGKVYPATRIDAALSNYFRLGNLTALRELALLWLADEVDSSLKRYRAEQGIDAKWEARERVVVALTGGPEGETLLRRGARIAARAAGGALLAVHVMSQDGLREANPGSLAKQRALVEQLGGSYHQVVGDDVPRTLVDFARASDATQLVIGVSRRSRLAALLSGQGIGQTVIRESGDIDVHIVSHAQAGGRFALPRLTGGLTRRRRVWGFAVALVFGPLLTLLLSANHSDASMASDVLSYQLLVVVVALIGGFWPAMFAAVLSGLSLDFFLVAPLHHITISDPLHLLALALFMVVAALVSYVVDQSAKLSLLSRRRASEAELLATVAGSVLRGDDALQALVSRTREAFGLTAVRLLDGDAVLYADGEPARQAPATAASTAADGVLPTVLPVTDTVALELVGRDLDAADRRLLGVIIAQIAAGLEHSRLAATAEEIGPLAAADRVRTALLAAVGHDLRRPLASATAAVTSLRSAGIRLDDHDRAALLDTAEVSLQALAALVTNLLDVSRVQAGVLGVTLADVDVDDVIPLVLDELQLPPGAVELELADDVPTMRADAALLQRAIVNILANALRFAPEGTVPVITASTFGGRVQVRVIDHGPGIPQDRRDDAFVAFQRLGDTDNLSGIGLGLAIAKGFVEGMGGTLEAETTPGGGLTMVISLAASGSTTLAHSDRHAPPSTKEA